MDQIEKDDLLDFLECLHDEIVDSKMMAIGWRCTDCGHIGFSARPSRPPSLCECGSITFKKMPSNANAN
jgi:hypothetical protein